MSDSDDQDVKFSLKVVFNKQKSKVLFAEADKAFTDVLLSFLTLPLGKIIRVLESHCGAPVIGSLTTLYRGLLNLESAHFRTEGVKMMVLNPRSWFSDEVSKLKLDINETCPFKYFACEDMKCNFTTNIGIYSDTVRCFCGKTLKREVTVKDMPKADDAKGGDFTIDRATFVISDDLQILPNTAGSVIRIVSNLGIPDTDWGELENVTFRQNEIFDLLKGLFVSQTPLSDVVLKKVQSGHALPGFEPGILLYKTNEKTTRHYNKMVLKVIVQKSTNRFLFAESDEEFVDFLCSLLTIPLGGVECLLGGKTCVKNIDNLYRSVVDVIDGKFFKYTDTKLKLTKPTLASGYCYRNQFLPLTERSGPKVYYCREKSPRNEYMSFSYHNGITCDEPILKSPRWEEHYVMGTGYFMITDDLTVMPQCMPLYVSTLNKLKIPFSDVAELELQIGLEEALSILKASLTSKSALSIGLSSILMKQPKQER